MKKLLIIISALFSQILFAQDTLHLKAGVYKINVDTGSNNGPIKGYLSSITDSTVNVSFNPVTFHGYSPSSSSAISVHYRNIFSLDLKRPGGALTGLLIGAVSGGVIGVIAGAASGDDNASGQVGCIVCFSAGEKAAAGGVLLAITGGLVGAGTGSLLQKTFVIKNSKEKFDEMRWQIVH